MKYLTLLLLATAVMGHVSAAVLPGPQSGTPKPLPAGPGSGKVLPGTGDDDSNVLPGGSGASLPGGGGNGQNVLPTNPDKSDRVLPSPANESGGADFFRSATTFRLVNLAGRDEGNNTAATRQIGEPLHGGYTGNPGGKSLWWRHVATFNGTLVLSTRGSNFDTVLAVYVGDSLESLVPVGYDDNGGPDETSLLTVRVNAGSTYYIAIDGYNGASGKIVLSATGLPLPNAMTGSAINDLYANRTELAGTYVFDYSYNYNATADEEEGYYIDGNSVWWRWVAPAAGSVTFHTQGSDFDTVMSVYRRNPPSEYLGFSYSYFNDDAGRRIRWSSITVTDVHAGEVFDIAVEGFARLTGMIVFTIDQQPIPVTTTATVDPSTTPAPPPPTRPTNENFDYRLGIQGESYSVESLFASYTRPLALDFFWSPPYLGLPEEGEPQHGNVATDQSVWWTWTAPASGIVTVSATAKPEDNRRLVNPVIGVYRGPRVSFLKTVSFATDVGQTGFTRTRFEVQKGETYQIAVAAPTVPLTARTTWMTGPFTFQLDYDRAAPIISKQPGNASIQVGDTASFSVSLKGTPLNPIKYQWQRRQGTGSWTSVKDNKTYAGAKTVKLTVSNVTRAMDGMQFRCVISNPSGKATSAIARLTVAEVQAKKKEKKAKKEKKPKKPKKPKKAEKPKEDKKLLGSSGSSGGKLLGN